MRALKPIAAAALLLLAACGSDDDEMETAPEPVAVQAPETGISRADAESLRAEIYPHWTVPRQPPCRQQIKVRIQLAADGRVVRAEARPEVAYDDPCRGAQDAAIRAIWAASPLDLPSSRDWDSITLIFDLDDVP